MVGTSALAARAMLRMPPRMTTAVAPAVTAPGPEGGDSQPGLHGVGDGMGLRHVAADGEGEGRQKGIEGGQHGLIESTAQVVHRPARHLSARPQDAEFDSQQGFGELGGHAHQSRDPHPEQGSRPARDDGGGHPGDVSGAHRGRQGGHQRLEVGDVAPGSALPAGHQGQVEGGPEPSELKSTQPNGQKQARAHGQGQHRGTPHQVGQRFQELLQVHGHSP